MSQYRQVFQVLHYCPLEILKTICVKEEKKQLMDVRSETASETSARSAERWEMNFRWRIGSKWHVRIWSNTGNQCDYMRNRLQLISKWLTSIWEKKDSSTRKWFAWHNSRSLLNSFLRFTFLCCVVKRYQRNFMWPATKWCWNVKVCFRIASAQCDKGTVIAKWFVENVPRPTVSVGGYVK